MKFNRKKIFITYCFLILIISTPLFFDILRIKGPDKPLRGVTYDSELPKLTYESFYSQKYQLALSKYLNTNFAFSATLIRIYNQIEFNLFHNINNSNVILGKDNYLFEPWYINAYYGKNFVGKETIDNQIQKLEAIDSVFASMGKTLIIAFAPGKASIYPEAIPDYKKGIETDLTNYKYYSKKIKETNLNVIDFNQWFLDLKPTFKRHLFTKGGTHWSDDMALHSLDSLIRYIEYKSGDSLNNIILSKINNVKTARGADDDLLEISNLLFDFGYNDYYYPKYKYENENKIDKTLITVSDSFFWNIYGKNIRTIFKDPEFWYYFKTAFTKDEPKPVIELNFKDKIDNSDYILLMSSPSPINKFGWGFIDKAYETYVPNQQELAEIKSIIEGIKSNPQWLESVKLKAIKKDISLETMMTIEAKYILETRKKGSD